MNWEKNLKYIEIPADLLNQANEMRQQMIEKIAELDDDLTMKYLEGETITNEELKAGLRKATIESKATPVFLRIFLAK